jgi:hypothetical protein
VAITLLQGASGGAEAASPTSEPTPTPTTEATPSPETAPSHEAGISVLSRTEADGDLEGLRSWEFEVTFEDGVEILIADPESDGDQPAGWLIRHAGDSTHVVITEISQDGYRLVEASCIDAESSDGMEISSTLDGNSLSFEVSGFEPFVGFPHEYFCDFRNIRIGDTALPTPPATDTSPGSNTGGSSSNSWHLVLMGLAALIASTALRSATATRSGGRA